MALHHGQGHQNDHQYISHEYIYLHAKFECHSLNILQDITIKVQIKAFVNFEKQWLLRVKVKVIGLRANYIDLYSNYLHSKHDGHFLKTF